jgi:hypothetical protein
MDMDHGTDSNPFDETAQAISAPALEDTNLNPVEDDHSGRNLVWLLLGMATMVCGLLFAAAFFFFQPDAQSLVGRYFPSSTATLTRTPTLTPTPNLTATQQAIQSTATSKAIQTMIVDADSRWNILLSDAFDTNQNKWYTGTDDDKYAKVVYTVANGKYHWDATAHKGFIGWVNIDTEPVSDFYLSVEIEQIESSPPAQYGLIFRKNDDGSYYYFGIEDGDFFISLNYKDDWIDLIDWTSAPAYHPNGSNKFTVIAKGSTFIFLINDQYLASVSDDRLPEGTLGLAVSLHDPDQRAVLEFDNFEIRVPVPSATPTPKIKLSPTVVPTAHVLWEPSSDVTILEEHFENNINKWASLYVKTTVEFRDEKMYMRSNDKGSIGVVLCWGCPIYDEDFYFQAELVLAKKAATGYGLVFCDTGIGNNYYVFQIQPTYQTFSLDQSTTNGWESLISGKATDLINEYPQSNTLAVRFDQGQIGLYINGVLADTYKDENPPNCRRTGIYVNGGLIDVIADDVFAYKDK